MLRKLRFRQKNGFLIKKERVWEFTFSMFLELYGFLLHRKYLSTQYLGFLGPRHLAPGHSKFKPYQHELFQCRNSALIKATKMITEKPSLFISDESEKERKNTGYRTLFMFLSYTSLKKRTFLTRKCQKLVNFKCAKKLCFQM